MSTLFGTPGSDSLSGGSATKVIAGAGNDTIEGVNDSIGQIRVFADDRTSIDGGEGVDRFVLRPFSSDLVIEVDPILWNGYTHGAMEVGGNIANPFLRDGFALLREIEEVDDDGVISALTTGSLTLHAENERFLQNGDFYRDMAQTETGATIVGLTGGQVVQVLQSQSNGLFFSIYNGEGEEVLAPTGFGDASGQTNSTTDAQVMALPDGGFALVWLEFFSPSSYSIHAAMYDADGTQRGADLTVAQSAFPVIDLGADVLPDGRLAIAANFNNSEYQRYFLVNDDATVATELGTEDFFFGRSLPVGAIGTDSGFVGVNVVADLQPGPDPYEIIFTEFTEDEMGLWTQLSSVVALTTPAGSAPTNVSVASLGGDDLAVAFIQGGTLSLVTRIGGTISTQAPALPQVGASPAQVSLTDIPGGGAYLTLMVNLPTSELLSTVYGTSLWVAEISAAGVVGAYAHVSQPGLLLQNINGGEVAVTDDGFIATWQDSGEIVRVSYRDAAGYNEVTGSGIEDALEGTSADDFFRGSSADETMTGGLGLDRYDGGAGFDIADLSGEGARYASLRNGYAEGREGSTVPTSGREALISVEGLQGGAEDDDFEGDDDSNVLRGGDGADTLAGLAGDDSLSGQNGNDSIDGGMGNDTLTGGGGLDSLFGGAGNDSLVGGDDGAEMHGEGGEDMIIGGSGADTAFGGDENDRIELNNGNDSADGGLGNDTIIGGSGADTLSGGDKGDDLDGGGGNDVIDGGIGADRLWGRGKQDVLDGGNGDDRIFGGGGNDTLTGGNNNDKLDGGTGEDMIDGGNGDDRLWGRNKADLMLGGAGNDLAVGGAGGDTIDGGSGNDDLSGLNGEDSLLGGEGDDLLDGGNRADILDGGEGNDTLIGGADTDVFRFNSSIGANADRITDFEDDIDTIEVTDLGYTARLTTVNAVDDSILMSWNGGTQTLLLEGFNNLGELADDVVLV